MADSFRKVKDIPVYFLIKEVIDDLKNYFFEKISNTYSTYSRLITSNNFFYLIFRRLTTQKIRDKIFSLFSSFKREKKHFFSEIEKEKFLGLKFLSLEYLNYCFQKQPKIPFSFFSDKDHSRITNFLKKFFYLALADAVPNKLLTKQEVLLADKKIKLMDAVKIKKGYFELVGFKNKVPFFENLIKPGDYKVSNKKINIVFDLGAYIGDTAFIFYKYLKAKKVYAFEPDPDNLTLLKENIKLNNLQKNVVPIELAAGAKEGFFYLEKAGSASSISEKKQHKKQVKVKVTTLDNFVKKNQIKKVDFIKMDIEGAEFDALKGAVKTLKRDKPDLLIAIYHKGEHLFEIPGWLKKQVPSYNLRFIEMNGISPIVERYIAASVEKI